MSKVSHMKRGNKEKGIPGKGLFWAGTCKRDNMDSLMLKIKARSEVIDEIDYEKSCVLCEEVWLFMFCDFVSNCRV